MSTYPILAPRDAYRRWAETWDNDPSPIVSLEARSLAPWLADLAGRRVLDVSCGTGRWMEFASRAGARVIGLDLSAEMLAGAARKPGLASRLAVAHAAWLPVADTWADIVLCTLSVGHMPDAAAAMAEMARVAQPRGAVIVSDFHPEAFRRGWKRTFRANGRVYEVENHYHPLESLVDAGSRCGLALQEVIEPCFGEPERRIYVDAGRPDLFDQVRGIPAVLLARWRKLE